VGMKPTRGHYPLTGVLALAPSLDVAGFLTQSVRDQALIWDAWQGSAIAEACSVDASRSVLRGLRLGVPDQVLNQTSFLATHNPQIVACFESALAKLQSEGARLVPVSLPAQDRVVQVANTLIAYEAFQQLQQVWRDQPENLGQGLRQKLDQAAHLSLDDYQSARAQAAQWQQEINRVLAQQADVLVWPGREALPETLQDLMAQPTAQRSACNRLYSLTGHPALTCPMGVSLEGLPMAIQIGCAMHAEEKLMRVAHAFESAIAWKLPMLLD